MCRSPHPSLLCPDSPSPSTFPAGPKARDLPPGLATGTCCFLLPFRDNLPAPRALSTFRGLLRSRSSSHRFESFSFLMSEVQWSSHLKAELKTYAEIRRGSRKPSLLWSGVTGASQERAAGRRQCRPPRACRAVSTSNQQALTAHRALAWQERPCSGGWRPHHLLGFGGSGLGQPPRGQKRGGEGELCALQVEETPAGRRQTRCLHL